MFKKVLIANRGEIAVRIIRACQERGIKAAAVFSDADRTALHVRYADEAYPIGPAPALSSYLNPDAILDAARKAGADALHPGYGFLSENADFAEAVIDAGLVWIGPSPEAMRLMGDKLTARKVMMAAGVPVVPGREVGLTDDEALMAAEELGYPLLIKASAGGGGKGMRRVESPQELKRALQFARREAASAFGNDTVYLERIIPRSRHIEIQILADHFGNYIHLGERECSIQRRNQKLIEESPSVAVSPALREQMGEIAIQAARAVGYTNAGTVEFLLDRDGRFYFLEMNTRLQVEHAVTELVTGVDIVKEQLTIAGGRRLHLRQEDVQVLGHAIECRINAEDPFNNFLPVAGTITSLIEPTGPGVRLESGIYAGAEVTPYYDSLLAKLLVWGENRAEAILRMRRALEELRISGIHTTVPFHQRIMDSARFQTGQFDTAFVEGPDGLSLTSAEDHPEEMKIAAIAAALAQNERLQQALMLGSVHQRAGRRGSNWRRAGWHYPQRGW